jgi:hypothetical protein
MNRNDRYDVFQKYCDENFCGTEGERGVRNLETLCETLGYGKGFMHNRAVEEFLSDNPGAIEAVLEFIGTWVERNDEWAEALADECGYEEEECDDA